MSIGQAEATYAPIVARAGTYYRNARYVMFVIIVAFGCWFLYDGFVKYPAQNRKHDDLTRKVEEMERKPDRDEAEYLRLTLQRKEMQRHDEFSIGLQKILGFLLPPIGLAFLVFWLHRSRGEIRLGNDVLTAPGSPAIPLAAIDEMDKTLWERKGISVVYYTLEGQSGTLTLDDFVYQAIPIRAIVKRIEDDLRAKDELAAAQEAEHVVEEDAKKGAADQSQPSA